MSTQCLIAEFTNLKTFETAIAVLEKANYSTDSVSFVTHAESAKESLGDEINGGATTTLSGEKTIAASTLVGGTLGAVLGTATLMGPLLIAGPILGMAAGAVGGSLLSTMHRFGVRQDVAEDYESKVAGGSRLIIVTGDELTTNNAWQVLKTCGPKSLETFRSNIVE